MDWLAATLNRERQDALIGGVVLALVFLVLCGVVIVAATILAVGVHGLVTWLWSG